MSSLEEYGVYLIHRYEKIRRVNLEYVIHNTPTPSGIVIDREQEIIKNDPL